MTIKEYWRDKWGLWLMEGLALFIIDLILWRFSLDGQDLFVIDLILVVPLLIYEVYDFMRRHAYYQELMTRLHQLDQPYLMGELLPDAKFVDGQRLNETIRQMTADLNERLTNLKVEQMEYYDYVELWVHEIKLPLSSLQLMIDNHHLEVKSVQKSVRQMDQLVQQSLFYAKSSQVNRDYHIKDYSSKQLLMEAIAKQASELIPLHFQIELPKNDAVVKTDKQWISFIIEQLVLNAIKYRKQDGANHLKVEIIEQKEGIEWRITDTGRGISAQDLPHIFEKGYTGKNGRQQQQSTGIGLYLCQKLCQQLSIQLQADSIEGKQTTMILFFPKHETILF